MSWHGFPRYLADIDVFLRSSSSNAAEFTPSDPVIWIWEASISLADVRLTKKSRALNMLHGSLSLVYHD